MRQFLTILLFLTISAYGQNVRVKLLLKDSLNDEPIENLRVIANEKSQYANSSGICVFNLSKGFCNIIVFKSDTILIKHIEFLVFSDTFIQLKLPVNAREFSGIVFKSKSPFFFKDDGRISIQGSILKSTPLPLSTNDPIQLIKLLPGVSTTQEMNSGLSIRGSNSYNSCIFLDDIPIPNLSHSFGLFSFFDTKNIRSIDYYNFNVSSEYGGKGSSYLKFFLNDPNLNSTKYDLSISPFLISGNVNTRIVRDKVGIYVYYRKSILSSAYNEIIPLFSRFNDFTFKAKFKINERSSLVFTGLSSKDRLKSEFGFGLNLNDSSIWKFNGYGLQYSYLSKSITLVNSSYYRSQELSSFNDQKKSPDSYKIIEINNRNYIKLNVFETLATLIGSEISANKVKRNFINDSSLFASSMNCFSVFIDNYLAMRKLYIFANLRVSKILGISNFIPENRFGFGYKTKKSSIKVELNEFVNTRHVISKNLLPTSFDLVLFSDKVFKPNKTRELIAGFIFTEKGMDLSINLYRRWFMNTFDYKSLSIANPNFQGNIVLVNQKSYGAELLSNFNIGNSNRFTISYTYSRSYLQNDSVNLGYIYPANYDRPHNLNLIFNKKIKRFYLFSTFNIQSGRPITKPLFIAYQQVPIFSKRNEFRLPLYHRLDIGCKYDFKKSKNYISSLSLHLYNVYFKKNIYGMIWDKDEKTGEYSVYYLSTFPFIPSFNYSISF